MSQTDPLVPSFAGNPAVLQHCGGRGAFRGSVLGIGALQAATMIVGEWDGASAVGLMPEDDLDSMAQKVKREITAHGAQEEDILVLSDIFVGSPFSSVATLMPNYKCSTSPA